jgi:hypothetical protein
MLFNCPRAKQIWATLGVGDKISDILQTDRSGSVLIEQMILHLGKWSHIEIGLPKLILTGAWYIWWERRQFTHGEKLQSIQRSAMLIGVLAANYWRVKKKPID